MAQWFDTRTAMRESDPKEVLKYEYIPYNLVIPTPDGDRPDDVTCVFHVEFVREDQFRKMYEVDRTQPIDERVLKGDPEKVIQDVKDRKN